MILDEILNETLAFTPSFFQIVLFLFLGAAAAVYLTALGQRLAALAVKHEKKVKTVSFNPLKQCTWFHLFSILVYIVFGGGWTKAPARSGMPGRDIAVSAAGPVLCGIVSLLFLLVYQFTPVILLRSLLLAAATSCVAYAFINILPLPGLCGGNILQGILPAKMAVVFESWKQYSMFVVPAAVFLLCRSGVVSAVIGWFISGFLSFFI